MAAPFEYEDLMEESIRFLEAHNNKYDLTSKFNGLRIATRRQYTYSPHLSASVSAPHNLSLQSPYPITITLIHHPNPAGNPSNKPITFLLKDTALTDIIDTDVFPWLFLHHVTNGFLKELDDGDNGPAHPSVAWGGDTEMKAKDKGLEIREEDGFVELDVGESKVFEVRLEYTGEGVELRKGEKYSIAFRGTWDLRGETISKGDLNDIPMIVIAATNLIEFTIVE